MLQKIIYKGQLILRQERKYLTDQEQSLFHDKTILNTMIAGLKLKSEL